MTIRLGLVCATIGAVLLGSLSMAAEPPAPVPGGARQQEPRLVSPERLDDGRITFRVRARNATKVTLVGDVRQGLVSLPESQQQGFGGPPAAEMTKGADGTWSGTTPVPVQAGAYRYAFDVDGAVTVDQSNTETSASQTQVRSLLVVPGDFSEQRNVPHGAVALVNYEAKTYGAGTLRQVIVYTPPGYERSSAKYPVLYLLHGGGDTAASWATVGRANFILDNLLAEKRIVPFIVVMMSGWTPRGPQFEQIDAAKDPFNAEFVSDIIPTIESRYRVKADRSDRALMGLSMGGFQTLTLGFKNVDRLAYVLPMSTGWFTDENRDAFVAANRAGIARADRELTLFWWGWGKTDIARENGLKGMDALRKAGITRIQTFETAGGHDWRAWRAMLHEAAPKLFR